MKIKIKIDEKKKIEINENKNKGDEKMKKIYISGDIMNKIFAGLLIISAILISGCISSLKTVSPVDPTNITVDIVPITIKEFQEQGTVVTVINNATEAIDFVTVASFEPFTVVSSGKLNIPARAKEKPSSAPINLKIQAPSFKTDTNGSAVTISYASGKSDKGEPIIQTRTVPVQTTVLPNAKLQFVGFVKGPANITEAEVTSWEIGKGQNATITFSVKNDGKTTIDRNTLSVLVDIENKEIGSNKTITIGEGMAKGGVSYTEGVVLPVLKNAPNGETEVYVRLLMGDIVIDSKTLTLKVRL